MKRRDVRYWHKADIAYCTAHVRFRVQSGHDVLHCKCLLLTQSGHSVAVGTCLKFRILIRPEAT